MQQPSWCIFNFKNHYISGSDGGLGPLENRLLTRIFLIYQPCSNNITILIVHGPDDCVRYGAVGERGNQERGQLSVKSLRICLTTTGVYLPSPKYPLKDIFCKSDISQRYVGNPLNHHYQRTSPKYPNQDQIHW